MGKGRWIRRSVFGAAAAIVAAAPAVFAQGQEVFEWSGRVDREVQITMRGNQLFTRQLGNNETGRYRARVMTQMPRMDGQLQVQVLSGRGNVDVIQQPTSQNGFTSIVRIRDDASGSDNYRIAAYWQNFSNGDYIGRGRRDRGDRDRDDVYGDRNDRNYPNGDRNDRTFPNGDRNGNGQYYPNGNRGYGQNMLHWSGSVDGELEIRIQNGRVTYRNLSGQQPTGIRVSGGNASMPRYNAQVSVIQNQGRGSVFVTQQPTSYNGYTTVLRVRDPQGGYGYYDFDLNWQ